MTRLAISHRTTYRYDAPISYALQQLRLTPKSHNGQEVIEWQVRITGGRHELSFEDQHRNTVQLVSFNDGAQEVVIDCTGIVEIEDRHGVLGAHAGYMPLWLFQRDTELTKLGPKMRALLREVPEEGEVLDRLHALSTNIREQVSYETGRTGAGWTGEEAAAAGHGVCQDHAHIFLGCARAMGVPARYVSGYLMMDDRVEQEATHAWAEAHVAGLGWVGFDISNGISPDTRYVRVATGLDYGEAAPTHGTRFGQGEEYLDVTVTVQEQSQQQQ
ncbi:transglutaminase family protein [Aestuariibius sp. 2305UL40-4]|uniref:transglutaminase family protein n=1 Tax=Aestuariibius violaceus TaxID=3234132 RepID=UPI00345EECDF